MAENNSLDKKIPALTVLKNNSILKNIFILDASPPPIHEDSGGDAQQFEETLWIGRHPDCNIILEHPSISRFHLRIDSKPCDLSFSVTDLSSVHGSWVCGKKLEPNVRVYLKEGDTLRLGGSSRIYRLHWVPMSTALVPPMDLTDPVDEKVLKADQFQTLDASKDLDYMLSDQESNDNDSLRTLFVADQSRMVSLLENHGVLGNGLEYNKTSELQLFNEADQESNDNDASGTLFVADQSRIVSLLENHGVSGNGLEHNKTSEIHLFSEADQESDNNDVLGTLSVADQSRMVSLLENPGTSPLSSAQKTSLSILAKRGVCASVQVFTCKSNENRSSACATSEGNSTDDDLENPATPPLRSPQKTSLSIRARRGVCASVQVFTGKSKENRNSACAESEGNSTDDDDTEIESISRNLFPCGSVQVSTGKSKENRNSASAKSEGNSTDDDDDTEIESISRNLFPCGNDEDDKKTSVLGTLSVADQCQRVVPVENLEITLTRSAQTDALGVWCSRAKCARVHSENCQNPNSANSTDPNDDTATESIMKNLFNCTDENGTSEMLSVDLSQTDSTLENPETPPGRSAHKNFLNIWSIRGKSASVQIVTGRVNEESVGADTEVNSTINSIPKNLCPWSPNDVEETFTPDKENLTFDYSLIRPLKKADLESMENELILRSWKSFSDEDGDEIYTPDKENITPDSLRSKFIRKIKNSEVLGEKNSSRSSPLKNMIGSNIHRENQEFPVFYNENQALKSVPKYFDSSAEEYEDEVFTPDKENITPVSLQFKSMKRTRKLEEIRDNSSLRSSPLKNMTSSSNKNLVPGTLFEQKYRNSTSRVGSKLTLQPISPKGEDGIPCQSLHVEPTPKKTMKDQGHNGTVSTRSKETLSHPPTQPVKNNATRVENATSWTMVVDTASLLKKESRQALTLLQGLKRTNLIIPTIVMLELDSIKRRGGFFNKTNEASSALQWIEHCLENAKRWIQVPSEAEEANIVPATPPSTRLSCFREQNWMFSANWFSPSGAFPSTVSSPTSDNHILECALLVRKSINGCVVLLSDDDTLKVKAMAEGLLCESAQQFREGLVNPFSERFLWTDSSPRGLTWSCMDDDVLREKFYSGPLKSLSKSCEVAKGLKLILPQNSQCSKLTPTIPTKMPLLKLILPV